MVEVLQGFGMVPSRSVIDHPGVAELAKIVSDFCAQTRMIHAWG